MIKKERQEGGKDERRKGQGRGEGREGIEEEEL